jgi:hypothetical protein
MKKSLLLAVSVCVLCVLSGCGSGGTKGSPVPIVNIVVSSTTITLGQSVTFKLDKLVRAVLRGLGKSERERLVRHRGSEWLSIR